MFDQPARAEPVRASRSFDVAETAVAAGNAAAGAASRIRYLFGMLICGFLAFIWGMAALGSLAFGSFPSFIGIGLLAAGAGWLTRRNWRLLNDQNV